MAKKVVIIAVLIIVAVALWFIFQSGDPVTRAILNLSDSVITIETGTGERVELEVKLVDTVEARTQGFRGVDPEVVKEHVLYIPYPFPASVAHRTEDLKTSIDIAFFDSTGQLLKIFQANPDDGVGYRPEDRYQYVVMARTGFFAEKGIDEESKILIIN